VTRDLVRRLEREELQKIKDAIGHERYAQGRFEDATALFEEVALSREFVEFLTLPGYARLP
jgi:malate synthase